MATAPTRTRRRAIGAAATLTAIIALAPATAHAGLAAGAGPIFPDELKVGQTFPGTVELRNDNTGTQGTATNGVCNLGDAFPCPAGDPGVTLIPSCGLQGAFSACAPGGADPGVFSVQPVATGSSGACTGMTFDVMPSDPTFGRLRFMPRGGRVLLPGSDAFCRITATFEVLKTPTIDIDPATAGIQTAQIVDNSQFFGALSASGRGSSTSVTIKTPPTLATTASPDIALGGQLTDAATVSGRTGALASTVDFRLYGPDDADCSRPPVFQSLNRPYPIAGGPLTSEPFTPTAVGTYRWRASYSGEANNAAVTAPCNDAGENVVVRCSTTKPGCPTLATTASKKGTQLIDTAVVSDRVNPLPSTIDFRLYGPDDPTCSGTPVFQSLKVKYPVAGGPVESLPYTPKTRGIHRWVATYSGDANNEAATGACDDANEQSDVTCEEIPPCGETIDFATARVRANPRCTGRAYPRHKNPPSLFQSTNTPFNVVVTVAGKAANVAKVEFRQNRRLVRTLTGSRVNGRYTLRVNPRRMKAFRNYEISTRVTLRAGATFSKRSVSLVKTMRAVSFTVVRRCGTPPPTG